MEPENKEGSVTDLTTVERWLWGSGTASGAFGIAAESFDFDSLELPLGPVAVPWPFLGLLGTAVGIGGALLMPEVRAWKGRYHTKSYEPVSLEDISRYPEDYSGKAVAVEGSLTYRGQSRRRDFYRTHTDEHYTIRTRTSRPLDVVFPGRLGYVAHELNGGEFVLKAVVEQKDALPRLYALSAEPKKVAPVIS